VCDCVCWFLERKSGDADKGEKRERKRNDWDGDLQNLK